MTENKIKYNSYENSFYINDDDGISQIIAPELIIEIINDYEKRNQKLYLDNAELKCTNRELYNENEYLKQEIGDLGTAHAEEITKIEDEFDEEILKLEKENEQLKQRINVLDDQITAQGIVIESYQNRNQKLFDEKEHIKQTIRDMIEYERTELGRSVLKQLWEAIK